MSELEQLRQENAALKAKLALLESTEQGSAVQNPQISAPDQSGGQLTLEEYRRYGRQLIVGQFGGPESQFKLKNAKVLVVGAGGLGCPALMYLAAAGVGTIGIVDPDTVDESNLHRQVLHTTTKVGAYKAVSAQQYLQDLNPHVTVVPHCVALCNGNSFELFAQYDLILDCTDTPMTRYLINDTAVLTGKTVVSGSGLKTEGQLSILNFANIGPCYRCFYPKPPSPKSVKSCSDGGVVGPCIGLVGVMMAVEAIKVLTQWYKKDTFSPFLTIYNGYESVSQSLRTFKMRSKSPKCLVCSEHAEVTRQKIESSEINYTVFCGKDVDIYDVITPKDQISVKEFADKWSSGCTLIDCRPKEHYNVVHLPGSLHIPLADLQRQKVEESFTKLDRNEPTFVVCRYGNDSRIATKLLKEEYGFYNVKDVKGGLYRWSKEVDETFPTY